MEFFSDQSRSPFRSNFVDFTPTQEVTNTNFFLSALTDCLHSHPVNIEHLQDLIVDFASLLESNIDAIQSIMEAVCESISLFDLRSVYIMQIPISHKAISSCIDIIFLFSSCDQKLCQQFFVDPFIPVIYTLAGNQSLSSEDRSNLFLCIKNLVIDSIIDDPYVLPIFDILKQHLQIHPDETSYFELLHTVIFSLKSEDPSWVQNACDDFMPPLIDACKKNQNPDHVKFAIRSIHSLVYRCSQYGLNDIISSIKQSISPLFSIHANNSTMMIYLFSLLTIFDEIEPSFLYNITIDLHLLSCSEDYAVQFCLCVSEFIDKGPVFLREMYDASFLDHVISVMNTSSFSAQIVAIQVFIKHHLRFNRDWIPRFIRAGLIGAVVRHLDTPMLPMLTNIINLLLESAPQEREAGFLSFADVEERIEELVPTSEEESLIIDHFNDAYNQLKEASINKRFGI